MNSVKTEDIKPQEITRVYDVDDFIFADEPYHVSEK